MLVSVNLSRVMPCFSLDVFNLSYIEKNAQYDSTKIVLQHG